MMAIHMNHAFGSVDLALCLTHLDKSLDGSVVHPEQSSHIWGLQFWTCQLLGSIRSAWSKVSLKAWWCLVKSATSFGVPRLLHLMAVSCWAFWGWHPPDASLQAAVDNSTMHWRIKTTPTAFNVQHELQRRCQAINHLGPCIHVWFVTWIWLFSGSGRTANTPYPTPKTRCCDLLPCLKKHPRPLTPWMSPSIAACKNHRPGWSLRTIWWFFSQLVIDIICPFLRYLVILLPHPRSLAFQVSLDYTPDGQAGTRCLSICSNLY